MALPFLPPLLSLGIDSQCNMNGLNSDSSVCRLDKIVSGWEGNRKTRNSVSSVQTFPQTGYGKPRLGGLSQICNHVMLTDKAKTVNCTSLIEAYSSEIPYEPGKFILCSKCSGVGRCLRIGGLAKRPHSG